MISISFDDGDGSDPAIATGKKPPEATEISYELV